MHRESEPLNNLGTSTNLTSTAGAGGGGARCVEDLVLPEVEQLLATIRRKRDNGPFECIKAILELLSKRVSACIFEGNLGADKPQCLDEQNTSFELHGK